MLGRLLTFPALPLLQDGLQPLLLLLRGLGHADEPLVLGRIVDLPAVVDDVATAVVVGCEAEMETTGGMSICGGTDGDKENRVNQSGLLLRKHIL